MTSRNGKCDDGFYGLKKKSFTAPILWGYEIKKVRTQFEVFTERLKKLFSN